MRNPRLVGYAFAVTLVACASSDGNGEVGVYPAQAKAPPFQATDSKPRDMAGSSAAQPDASQPTTTRPSTPMVHASGGVRIAGQDLQPLKVEIVALTCLGSCATVDAVASGGHPPYAFRWEDGSTEPKRLLCADTKPRPTLTASDTAIEGAEFGYAPQTVSLNVPADLFDCDDGGVSQPKDGTPAAGGCKLLELAAPQNGCDGLLVGSPAVKAGKAFTLMIDSQGFGVGSLQVWASSDGCSATQQVVGVDVLPGQHGPGCASTWFNEDYQTMVYKKIGVAALLPTFSVWVCDSCPF